MIVINSSLLYILKNIYMTINLDTQLFNKVISQSNVNENVLGKINQKGKLQISKS